MRRCLDDALESGVRLDLTDAPGGRAAPVAARRSRGVRPRRGGVGGRVRAAAPRGLVRLRAGGSRAAARASRSATTSGSPGRSTGSTSTRSAPAGSCRTTSRGKGAHSAAEIDRELRLQIPLYMLVLRDLVGVEPLGGVYRALAGQAAHARHAARERARGPARLREERLPRRGARSGRRSRPRAGAPRRMRRRIRAGDVRHDPKGDGCPSWCDLWPVCRVERA